MLLQAFAHSQTQQKRQSVEIPQPSLRKRPIIEHHVHAEGGTLDPQELRILAERNAMPIPEALFGPNNTLKYKEKDFFDFLSVYDQATSYILTPRDIQEVIYRYLKRCHQEGAVYVELTCSPDHVQKCRKTYKDVQEGMASSGASSSHSHQEAGENISYAQFVDAVAAGIDQANKEFGIEARILMVLLRHNGKEAAMKTLDDMLAYRHPYVVGMNLAGDEENFPPELFTECYAKAKQHGLKLTAHVGEHAGPEKIVEAVEKLRLDRVGHGVTAVRSELVMDFLRDRKIALELCPSSNLSLGLFPSLNEHPLRKFFDKGILFSINSDDPTFFGSSLGEEFAKVQAHWGFTDEEMLMICRNSVTTSFAEYSLKHQLTCLVNLYDEFQKLKKLLEPFKQNLIYQRLQTYEATPNAENFNSFKEALNADFADIDIPNQVLVFTIAHNNMVQSRLNHQQTVDLELQRFKDSHINKLTDKFEVATLN